MDNKVKEEGRYTQRQWDRTVGWGKVPEKYDAEIYEKTVVKVTTISL